MESMFRPAKVRMQETAMFGEARMRRVHPTHLVNRRNTDRDMDSAENILEYHVIDQASSTDPTKYALPSHCTPKRPLDLTRAWVSLKLELFH